MERDLEGKLALVTGGGKGVGRVVARQLARRGATVIINFFHSLDAAKETRAQIEAEGGEAHLIRASVALEAQVDKMFAEIQEKWGYLDILVNNAASGAFVEAEAVTQEYFDRALNTNLKGAFWCARRAAPLMAKRGGGVVVNVSSIGAGQVIANYIVVGTSKAAVESLTRYLAVEYAPLNIRVNTASATMLEGEVAHLFPRYEEMKQVHVQATPLGRLGTEEDLANVVMFLTSDQSRWVTGQTILADGGLSLNSASLGPPRLPAEMAAPASNGAPADGAPAVPTPSASQQAAPAPAGPPRVPTPVPAATPKAASPASGIATEEIAVVGMGLAVPGANNPEEFWKVMMEGPDLFTRVPSDRWEGDPFYSPDHSAEDKTYQDQSVFMTGFVPTPGLRKEPAEDLERYEFTTLWLRHALIQALEGVKRRADDRFSFVVGYTPDGSQHLEEALVLSGTLQRLRELLASTSGPAEENEALLRQIRATLERYYPRGTGKASHFLPHMVGRNAMHGLLPDDTVLQLVDTACSSSLYSVDIGIKGLLMGKQEIAACGGSFALAPRGSVLFAKLHGLSASGRVRSLDRTADGVLFADGAGVVILKTLRRAQEDGDPILAVLKAFGSSSDGKGKAIYAPSSVGQSLAIRRALTQAGGELENIDWVVAHATGTPAGDLAEFTTIREMMRADHPVCVTSNKSLIGHTGWAAGVVSLIEVILGLQKGHIPPQFQFTAPPADFEIEQTNLVIPKEAVPWPPRPDRPRAASVSSFGFGGTNAHQVVEEYRPDAAPAPAPERPYGERIAVVGWSAHLPGLDSGADVKAWLLGEGAGPGLSFGEAYPMPPFDQVRMPPSTIRTIDRCQLMVLEVAHGLRRQLFDFWEDNREKTGVFMGHMGSTRTGTLYASRCHLDAIRGALEANPEVRSSPLLEPLLEGLATEVRRLVPPSNQDSFPGAMPNVIPARVANYFDLKGPNMTLDTGFSSTLTALEVASRYLRSGELEMALVGGIHGNITPENNAVINDLAAPETLALAEGAFLFALVRESTAARAGLTVLGYVDDFAVGSAPEATGRVVTCGLGREGAPRECYAGAEGAVALLKALLDPRPQTQILCRDAADAPATVVRLTAPDAEHTGNGKRDVVAQPLVAEGAAAPSNGKAHLADEILLTDEYAPGAPLNVRRQVVAWEEFPLEPVRETVPFFAAGALVLTDRAELLDQAGPLPEDVVVFSTTLFPRPGKNRVHLPEITPKAVEAAMHGLPGPVTQLRILASLGASAPPDASLSTEPASLVALHDLTFLVLKQCFDSLTKPGSLFAALFLDAVPASVLHPLAGLFSGMIKSTALELLPDGRAFAVFTSAAEPREGVRQAEAESGAKQFLPVLLYHEGVRKTAFMHDDPGKLPADAEPRLDEHSVVVATAGARGITAELMKALARHYRPTLYLLGSNRLDTYPVEISEGTDEEWAARRKSYVREQKAAHPKKTVAQINKEFDRMSDARAARRNIQEMIRHCGPDRVHYLPCDVFNRDDVARVIQSVVSAEGKIDLLVNAAGLNRAASIPVKSFEDFRAVRNIKLQGYQNLKAALGACRPRMWCNFGSLVGITGQLGEVDYAAGNDFLTTAAVYASQAQGADEFTIAWSLWSEVGLGTDPVKKTFLENSGQFSQISTEEGIHHFLREVNLARHDPATIQIGASERQAITVYFPDYFEYRSPAAGTAAVSAPAKRRDFYLDRVLSQSDGEMLFERVFDLERDAYLNHHVVNGYATLPGTFVPEIATEAASRLVPGRTVVALEDAVFHHFLRVYDPSRPGVKRIHARVIDENEQQTTVQVRVLTDVVSPSGVVLTRDKLHFEIKAILAERVPSAPYWEHWPAEGEMPVPDPYHFPNAPVLLTDMFVSTTDTRSHPLGTRATYRLRVPPDDPVFSSFRIPSILLDGLARVAALHIVDGAYIPLVAPITIRRIDVYEALNDCELARTYDPIQLYVTPSVFALEDAGTHNRFVAVRPDGRIILQIKDVTGAIIGYVHRDTGAFVSRSEVDGRREQREAHLVGA